MKKYRDIILLCLGIFLLLFFIGNVCPLERLIGIPCPGCNMFTACYWLIKGNLEVSFYYHPALLPLLLYGVGCIWMYYIYRHDTKNKNVFRVSTLLFLIVFIGIYIVRMIMIFPNEPMRFNNQAILIQLFHLF